MKRITGVRFRQAEKIFYFRSNDLPLKRGSHVIAETKRGVEYGTVVIPPHDVNESRGNNPKKPIVRMATEEDDRIREMNREKEREAYKICREKILEHGLKMKLVKAEYTFDRRKLLFYFTADGRVDFRSLVKDLACAFHTRIELRQIGVRDEAKMLGGIGSCGRPLCCHTFLSGFAPVSIKMAKVQNMSLSPTKISGTCGRLLCCLKNEQETYEHLKRHLPKVGDYLMTVDGFRGKVSGVSVLRQTVKVIVDVGDEKDIREYHIDQIRSRSTRRKDRERPRKARSTVQRGDEKGSEENE